MVPGLGPGSEAVGGKGVGYDPEGGTQRPLPLTRGHHPGELAPVGKPDLFCHLLGLCLGDE